MANCQIPVLDSLYSSEHRALPQLEVRVAPPDEYQPEV